ncbi:DUF2721 domain-containing protein [Paludibaculum fermentans]|uniref:DUF2721 domain-containing protein n=1 Tax=Paludibaculum fermentans TaxID=1473598 RepID=UPI001ACD3A48|nr:DUF2721 domain-containing protein [Acidobacteriota bacterium]
MWPHIQLNVTNLGTALNVLAAMITPALLLSACGTFILSTSNRLARIVDRMRSLSHQLDEMSQGMLDVALREERIEHHRGEIKLQGRRLNLIQRALTLLYLAAVNYVCTSVAIGLASTFTLVWVYWVPVFFGIGGACCMLVAAVMLALEARLAVKDLYDETEFHRRLARYYSDQQQTRLPEA